jgi:hypothetical protein
MRSILAGAVVLFSAAILCAATPQTQPQSQTQTQPQTVTLTYSVIAQGTFSGFKDPLQKIITANEEWQDLWKKHVSVIIPQPPVPTIDFNTSVLAVIFLGEKKSSGYQIRLKEVAPDSENVIVKYHPTEPPANSFTLQVLSQPYLILRIDKPKGQVTFQTVTGAEEPPKKKK